MTMLAARGLTVAYEGRVVLDGLDVDVPEGELTAIVGPNACGKSTLLRTLARVQRPRSGSVLLDGVDIRSRPTRDVARMLALLPQNPVAPEGIGVRELVGRGRHPHRGLLAATTRHDDEAVDAALHAVGLDLLGDRPVAALSGGQRQRAWIAMVLAQDTPLLLLDEPTTFLDLARQIEVLELVRRLRDGGRTVVAVLHDLNHAARFATHIVAMRDGAIVAQGDPRSVVTADLVEAVLDVRARILVDPDTGSPVVLPLGVTRREESRG